MENKTEKQTPVGSDELFALREAKRRFEAAFVRIAKAHGIDSPLVLTMMAENNEENYAEILARHVETVMANDERIRAASKS